MSGLGRLNIELSLDAVKFQQNLKKSEQQARLFANRTVEYLKNIETAANNINSATRWNLRFDQFDKVRAAAKQLIDYADKNTELANKLKLVTETELQHAQALSTVYDISMKTAQSTQAVSAVYQSFAQNAKELGISQRQVAEVTETISKAVAISGASTAEAQNALTQFGQVLLMGKFRAQEYNSVMTQTPAVMQAIARGLGVTMAELKAMSDDGKLTTDKIIQGLDRSKKSVDELYGKTATTVSGAMQNLSTATQKWVGEMDSSLGVTKGVTTAIDLLANSMGTLMPYVTNIGIAFAGVKLSKHTAEIYRKIQADRQQAITAMEVIRTNEAKITTELNATRAYIQSLQAQLNLTRVESTRAALSLELQAQVARETALIRAKTAATNQLAAAGKSANLLSSALTALGGPIGLVTMGLTLGATWLYNWYQEAEQAKQNALDFVNQLDELNGRIQNMSVLELNVSTADTRNSIDEQKKKIQELEEELAKLEKISNQKTYKVTIDYGTGEVKEFTKSLGKQQEELDAVNRKKLELKQAADNLAKSEKSLAEQMNQIPVAELKEQFSALFPQVEQSQIKVDGLNVSIGNLTVTLPQATIEALKFAGAIGSIATGAIQAAVAVANLNKVNGGALGEDTLKFIENNKKQAEIARLRKAGKDKEADELQAALNVANKGFTGADYEAALQSEIELLNARRTPKTGKSGTKSGSKTKSGEDYRNDWDKYYDDLVNANATAWEKIRYEQEVAARELDKHLSHGVVSQAEAEKARALIAQQYSKQRRELAGQYAPEIAAQEQLKQQLQDITQLRENEALTAIQAIKAREKAQYDYAQNVAQNAVNPLAQFNAQFDPYQEIENQRTRDLALLDAMQDSNGQKLLAEEDYQQKRQQIIDKYDLERQKKEADYYTQSTQMMSSAFDTMAGVMANAAGQQSAAYKAMFAVSKAFAIAESIIKIQQGIAEASALPYPANLAAMASVAASTANIVATIQSVTMGFSGGGYTGDGGKYTPAGIVHKGEYVITKEATARLGLGYLNYLNYGKRGFANGGGVAVPTLPTMRYQPSNAGTGRISVNVINNGEPMEANVSQKERNGQMEITVELMRQIARNETNSVLQSNFRAGGMFAR